MSDLFTELIQLRPGRGVLTGNLVARIGPLLRARAGIDDSDGPGEISERLIAYLESLAGTLPPDLALAFRVGLSLHPQAQFRFLDERMEWLAMQLDRDARTARRRFDEAARLLELKSREAGGAVAMASGSMTSGSMTSVPAELPAHQTEYLYRPQALAQDIRIGFITGDIRRVKCADIWVNPENTRMEMARFEEHSVSAIIRYLGARRDETGQVVEDRIADALLQKVGQHGQVAPCTAIATDSGNLLDSNRVRSIVHVATVQGEPGAGYRQVHDIGHCVTKALEAAEKLAAAEPVHTTILFPILGAGVGGAEPTETLRTLVGAALDHLLTARGGIRTILFLAYSTTDFIACRTVFEANPQFLPEVGHAHDH
ncbi:macro domain-containing protein [Acrocarpospora sp. B8E8]|uniref:macro domain-containing protein n=1 Tax=Acrocarpospora sp. B8E8 TaxID=3153572 RepID=UPI00325D6CBA